MSDLTLPQTNLRRRDVPRPMPQSNVTLLTQVRCSCGARVFSYDHVIYCSQCSNAWLLEAIEYEDLSHVDYDGTAELLSVSAFGGAHKDL